MVVACNKDDIAKGTPKCIKNDIKDFEKSACDKGANVKKYIYQSKDVYVFYPGTCGADMTSEVLDEDCNSLGYLGGLTGNTTINGGDFGNATYKETVWEN